MSRLSTLLYAKMNDVFSTVREAQNIIPEPKVNDSAGESVPHIKVNDVILPQGSLAIRPTRHIVRVNDAF